MMSNDNIDVLKETNKIYVHKHILSHYMSIAIADLSKRSLDHDNSKLTPEELEGYVKYGPILDSAVIGTKEYDEALELMKEYNKVHYARNRHHPEHHEDGINDMNLMDILELFCDWTASSDVKNTDVMEVMEGTLFERFGIDEQLGNVIKNTLKYMRAMNDTYSKTNDITEV